MRRRAHRADQHGRHAAAGHGAAENALRGGQLDDDSIAAAAEQAAEGTDPPGDLNATPDYKRHLARVLAQGARGGCQRLSLDSPAAVQEALARERYLADRGLSTAVYLAATLEQPLLLEGEAGVGKTEVAKALAGVTGARLIRFSATRASTSTTPSTTGTTRASCCTCARALTSRSTRSASCCGGRCSRRSRRASRSCC